MEASKCLRTGAIQKCVHNLCW